MASATSNSMAATATLIPRPPTKISTTRCSLPILPPRANTTSFSTSLKQLSGYESSENDFETWRWILQLHSANSPAVSRLIVASESRRSSLFQIKATEESTPVDAGELFTDLKEKWDAVENKSTVITYGGGAIVVVWISSIVVGAINSVPVLPKIMELVGLGYTGWFVYRYLLFKSSRKELATDIESIKKKITGTE